MAIFSTQEVASAIMQTLNTISKTLYDDSQITSKIVFYGTESIDIYERFREMEFAVDDTEKVTPFLLTSIDYAQELEDYLRYEENFKLTVYGFTAEKDDLCLIFNELTRLENTVNRREIIEGFTVEKLFGKISIEEDYKFAKDGTNEGRFSGTLNFIWNVSAGLATSEDIDIKINNVSVPHNMINLMVEKRIIPVSALSTSGISTYLSSTQDWSLLFNFPLDTSNSTLFDLFKDMGKSNYNKTYALEVLVSSTSIFKQTMYIEKIGFVDTRPAILDFEVVFKRVPAATTTIKIDDVQVPVLSYKISSKNELESYIKLNQILVDNDIVGRQWSISLELPLSEVDANATINEIFAEVISQELGNTHTITLNRNSGTFEQTYTVMMLEGSYEFSEDANQSFTATFIKVGD